MSLNCALIRCTRTGEISICARSFSSRFHLERFCPLVYYHRCNLNLRLALQRHLISNEVLHGPSQPHRSILRPCVTRFISDASLLEKSQFALENSPLSLVSRLTRLLSVERCSSRPQLQYSTKLSQAHHTKGFLSHGRVTFTTTHFPGTL
jgi:hypothetical protein